MVQALEKGHKVSAFVRDKSKISIQSPQLSLIEGNVLDSQRVAESIKGHEIVLSALGKLDATERVQAIENIIAGMQLHGVSRIIAIGGVGCLQITETMRYQQSPSFPPFFIKTSLAHWEVCTRLSASGLEWTFVCPPEIPDGERTGSYTTVANYIPAGAGNYGGSISTGDLADFMLSEAIARNFVRARVGIAHAAPAAPAACAAAEQPQEQEPAMPPLV
jgi:putative NADH-flavin reductase